MPYAPYVYIVAISDNFTKEHNTTVEISFKSNMPLLGDICYLEAIKKRADNNVPDNTKEQPDFIVQNNMEYVSEYNITTGMKMSTCCCRTASYAKATGSVQN